MLRDYRAWHDHYDNPEHPLAVRLGIVQSRLSELLSAAPPGPIRLLSMCAGQGRDVLGVLPAHERRQDVTASLVELDPENVAIAKEVAAEAGLSNVDVIEADASVSDVYAPLVPADIVLACGIFGNVSDDDVERTSRSISMLCAPGAAIMWTRHRREPDLNPSIRAWLAESGFEVLTFDAPANETMSGVGAARLVAEPLPWRAGHRFFRFIR